MGDSPSAPFPLSARIADDGALEICVPMEWLPESNRPAGVREATIPIRVMAVVTEQPTEVEAARHSKSAGEPGPVAEGDRERHASGGDKAHPRQQ